MKLYNDMHSKCCSSRTDKNELCVLGECILHPTCCIVIKVPQYYTTLCISSQYAVHSFERICILKPDPLLLLLQGFTRQKCDPILTGLMLTACSQLQHGNHDLRKWLQRKHQLSSSGRKGRQSVFDETYIMQLRLTYSIFATLVVDFVIIRC